MKKEKKDIFFHYSFFLFLEYHNLPLWKMEPLSLVTILCVRPCLNFSVANYTELPQIKIFIILKAIALKRNIVPLMWVKPKYVWVGNTVLLFLKQFLSTNSNCHFEEVRTNAISSIWNGRKGFLSLSFKKVYRKIVCLFTTFAFWKVWNYILYFSTVPLLWNHTKIFFF